jgi:transcriptional regulator with XRE-family HTH domain
MNNSQKYLVEVKRKLNLTSDYSLAKVLGVGTNTISQYQNQKRVMDDTMALRIAEILEIDPMKIIAAANADRETGKAKEKWESFYKQLGGLAASLFISVNLLLSPTPTEAAPVQSCRGSSVYIMLSRRVIQAVRNLARAVWRSCQMPPLHVGCLG